MAGISSKALNNAVENKRRFNYGSELQNKEFSDGSGLDVYDTRFRQLDPQIGRWWQIDAHAEYHLGTTPYGYVLNNPLLYNDPFGLDTVRVNGEGSHSIKVRQGDVLAWTIGETTSYYTYDPNNKNAVNGFVGEGIDGGTLPEVTVSSSKSQNQEQSNSSSGYTFPWASAAGTATSVGSHLTFNRSGWYSFSQSKFYSPRFHGNQYTAGGQKAAKATSVKLTRLGYGIGLYNMYDINMQYQKGQIGQAQLITEQGMNAISTFGGIYGAAAGVGWELGRGVSSIPWYRANIRPLIQDGLGVQRDEYPKTPFLDQLINEMDKQ